MHIPTRANHSRKRKQLNDKCCYLCGLSFWPVLEYHHIIPVSEGGADTRANISFLCPTCHAIVHHFRVHHELYAMANKLGKPTIWQFKEVMQLEYYAIELKLNEQRFVELVKANRNNDE